MAKSNADRQREWRLRHQAEPRGNRAARLEIEALRARVAELEAELAECNWPGQPIHFRLVTEFEEEIELTWDETVVDHLLGYLIEKWIFSNDREDHFLPLYIDLIRRAPAALLDACERAWAMVEEEIAEKVKGMRSSSDLDSKSMQVYAGTPAHQEIRPRIPQRYRRYSLRDSRRNA